MKIGNLRGIRVPKVLLDQARLGDEIELEVQENKLIVQAVRSPRQGWDEQFAEMARRGEDKARLVRGAGSHRQTVSGCCLSRA